MGILNIINPVPAQSEFQKEINRVLADISKRLNRCPINVERTLCALQLFANNGGEGGYAYIDLLNNPLAYRDDMPLVWVGYGVIKGGPLVTRTYLNLLQIGTFVVGSYRFVGDKSLSVTVNSFSLPHGDPQNPGQYAIGPDVNQAFFQVDPKSNIRTATMTFPLVQ